MRAGGWPSIILIYWYGMLCTSASTKMVPVVGDLQESLAASPTAIGFTISILVLVTACVAGPGGWLIERVIGFKRAMAVGALIYCLTNIGEGVTRSYEVMLTLRILEGFGFLILLTTCPAMLIRTTDGNLRVRVLGGWSVVMALGAIAGLQIGAVFAGSPQFRMVFLAFAVLAGVSVFTAKLLPQVSAPAREFESQPSRPAQKNGFIASLRSGRTLRLGGSFGAQQIVDFGGGSIIPVFLMSTYGISATRAASIYGASLMVRTLGGLCAAVILGRGVRPGVIALLAAIGVVSTGVTLFTGQADYGVAVFCTVVLNVSLAVLAAITSTLLAAPGPGGAGATTGVVYQIAMVGSFLGPPLFFRALESGTWLGYTLLVVVFTIAFTALLPVWNLEPDVTPSLEDAAR